LQLPVTFKHGLFQALLIHVRSLLLTHRGHVASPLVHELLVIVGSRLLLADVKLIGVVYILGFHLIVGSHGSLIEVHPLTIALSHQSLTVCSR
jgi:hypothetical protein